MASDRDTLEKTNRGGMLGCAEDAFRALGRSLNFVNFIFKPDKPGIDDFTSLGRFYHNSSLISRWIAMPFVAICFEMAS